MRLHTVITALILTLALAGAGAAREAQDYIDEASRLQQAGDLTGALEVMKAAVAEHPDDSNVNAYLGLYTGMMAGRTTDYM